MLRTMVTAGFLWRRSPCAEQDLRVGRGGAVEQMSAVAEMQVVERKGVCALDGHGAVRCYRADLFLELLLGHPEQAGQAPVQNLEVAVGIVSRVAHCQGQAPGTQPGEELPQRRIVVHAALAWGVHDQVGTVQSGCRDGTDG